MLVEPSFGPLIGLPRDTMVSLVRRSAVDLSARPLAVFLNCYLDHTPQMVRGLARELNTLKPAITRALHRLAEFDLIRRRVDSSDRRSILLQLTQKGTAFLNESRQIMAQASSFPPKLSETSGSVTAQPAKGETSCRNIESFYLPEDMVTALPQRHSERRGRFGARPDRRMAGAQGCTAVRCR
jgi:DNA-binding MarR family transcriptional regulator